MRRLIVAGAALIGLTMAAYAQSAEDFYRGKVVTYIVATAPGGGYDAYARLISRYIGKYLAGAKVIVLNVPGAGHIVGADEVYVAKPDGLTIGTFNTALIFAQLLKQPGVQFDLAKMSWIGKAASDPRVLVIAKNSGIKSWAGIDRQVEASVQARRRRCRFGRLYRHQNRDGNSSSQHRRHSRIQRQRRRDEHAARRDRRHDRFREFASALRRSGQRFLRAGDRRLGEQYLASGRDIHKR